MTTRFSRPSLLALAVSLSAFSGGVTLAAEEMDHSAMGHGTMSMDHSQMSHGATKAPMEGMDHSKMDHGAMQSESGSNLIVMRVMKPTSKNCLASALMCGRAITMRGCISRKS